MPAVHYALTNAVKRQWADYWTMRPTANPMDLETVLDQCQQAIDLNAYDFEPADGAELWEHADIPDHAFIVKDSGVEWVVTKIVPKKRHRAKDLMKRKPRVVTVDATPVQVVTVCHELAPDIGIEPDGTPQERWAWAKATVETLSTWLSRNTRHNPKYAEIVALNNQMMRRQKGLRLEVERLAEMDMSNDERGELFEANGKIVCIPAVKWLLNRVKELQARGTELDSNHRSQP